MAGLTKSILFRCVLIAAGLPLLLLAYFAFVKERPKNPDWLPASAPQRIISFAPNATEMLYELGLGDRVAGVTQFCNYPPDAAQKEKVGAHTNPNYEAILRLKPDLMIILKEQRDLIPFLDKYNIRYVTIGSDSVDEIIESIRIISTACGEGGRGDSLAQKLREKLDDLLVMTNKDKSLDTVLFMTDEDKSSDSLLVMTNKDKQSNIMLVMTNKNKPTVLFCVSRDDVGSGTVGKLFAAGTSSFYNQLIESAGGINALKNVPQAYPSISAEAVVRLNPDIIIDISLSYITDTSNITDTQQVTNYGTQYKTSLVKKQGKNYSVRQETGCGDWNVFQSVAAVKTKNVHCLSGGYLMIPGPRFVLILEDLKTIFSEYAQTRS